MGAGNDDATAKIALFVSIPVAVVLLVLLTVALYLCKRKNNKPHEHVQISSSGECFSVDYIAKRSPKKENIQA